MKILIVLSFWMILACSDDKKNNAIGTTAPSEVKQDSSRTASPGQLALSIDRSVVDPKSVDAYVVGHPETKAQLQEDGETFILSDLPAGNYDVVVAGQIAIGSSLHLSGSALGERRNGIGLADGQGLALNFKTLPPAGSLDGKVSLRGATDHAGIDVYIPGTSYLAKTAANGTFVMDGLPVGEHALYFEKDGYGRGILGSIAVKSAAITHAPEMTLVISNGVDAKILLNGGATVTDHLKVAVTIVASANATLMMLAEAESFTDARWRPVETNTTFDFSVGGERKLYAKFADANGLESAPVMATIIIDTEGPVGSISLAGGVALTKSRMVTIKNDITDKYSTVTAMRLGTTRDLSTLPWQAFSEESSLVLPAGSGEKTVFAQFKDSSHNLSDVLATKITLDAIAPSVATVTPAANASGVARDQKILVNFSEAIDTTATAAFTLTAANAVSITTTASQDEAVLTPAQELEPNTLYTVGVSTALKDLAGNPLSSSFSSVFQTASYWTTAAEGLVRSRTVSNLRMVFSTDGKGHLFWSENVASSSRLFMAVYTPGSGFGAARHVPANFVYTPSWDIAACGDGSVIVGWYDRTLMGVRMQRYSPTSGWPSGVDTEIYTSDNLSMVNGLRVACSQGSSGKAVIVFDHKNGGSGNYTIEAVVSDDAGDFSSPTTSVLDTQGSGNDATYARVCMDSADRAFVVWTIGGEYSAVNRDIYSSRLSAGSWTNKGIANDITKDVGYPELHCSAGGKVVLAWYELQAGPLGNIVAHRFDLAADAYTGTRTRLTSGTSDVLGNNYYSRRISAVALDDGKAYVVWLKGDVQDGTGVVQASAFDGTSWLSPLNLSAVNHGYDGVVRCSTSKCYAGISQSAEAPGQEPFQWTSKELAVTGGSWVMTPNYHFGSIVPAGFSDAHSALQVDGQGALLGAYPTAGNLKIYTSRFK